MRLLVALFLSALLCACAGAPPTPPSAANPATEAPPARSAAVQWRYIDSKSYEALNAGLGNSHRFESSVGWVDVYVYDMKRSWQPGVGDPQFDDHFRSTIAEVQSAVAQGVYASARMGPTRDVRIEGLTFRTVSFRLMHARGGKAYDSFTYLAVRNGKLLKYRMSFNTPAPAPADAEAIAREFIERNVRTGPETPAGTRQLRST
ncbi:hypothetical protein [uncultured Variovorax sp.]|uniref:hypothetical protein n=1 Tax=uncultured Variovorax sp. TaxID=114708 RepID=UPI0025E3F9E8|nr:hypothetical protein [uncultured Variovorax sp.]